jgi:hypothetical protein
MANNLTGFIGGLPNNNKSNTLNDYSQDLEKFLPGIGNTLGGDLNNINDLVRGVESPAITQNMNAVWGQNSGMGQGSDFLRNRAVDLYGQRGAQRQQAGHEDLLSLLSGASAGLSSYRGQDINRELGLGNIALGQQGLDQRQYEFGQTFPWEKEKYYDQANRESGKFQQDLDLRKLLGKGQLNQNSLNSYLNFLSP